MRKTLSFFLLLLLSMPVLSQEGAPVLTHFREDRDIENQNWAICQDRDKVMLFANRKGILAFYGTEHTPDNPAWISVRMQVTPYSMKKNPADNRIYIGGENDYGVIGKDHKGIYRYESLNSDSSDLGIITSITFNDSTAFFSGDKSVSCYNIFSGELTARYIARQGKLFTGIILKDNDLFINVSRQGLCRAEADSLYSTVSGYMTVSSEVLFSLPYDKKRVLVGMGSGKISLFDGVKFSSFELNDGGYIEKNILSGGTNMGDSLYIFSTVGGGAVVADKSERRVRSIINNQNGLPDDEILAIGCDESGGLWLSHPFGLTRADLRLPIKNYGIYEGLTGNLSTAIKYNGELYAATSEGVFYLAPEKSYDEVQLLRNVVEPLTMSVQIQKENPPDRIRPAKREEDNTRKSIFNRIFGKKPDVTKEDEAEQENSSISGSVNVREVPQIKYRTDTIRTLRSITFMFKKVSGLNEKCRQLVPTENGILAATNMGLYLIKDYEAELIAADRYINYISWKPFNNSYSIAASDGYFIAENRRGTWTVNIPDKTFREPVYSVERTGQNTFWLGCDNSAYYRYTGDQGTDAAYSRFKIENSFSQRYLVKNINDTIFLFTDTSISIFNEESDEFIPYNADSLAFEGQEVFGYPLSNIPLVITGNRWIYPEKDKRIKDKALSMLRLFENVSSVFCEGELIWIVDGQNRLYGVDCSKSSAMTPETDLFIKNVRNDKGMSFSLSDIVFERGDNIIEFDIVAPAYHNKNLTQYQYMIDNILDWSPWSLDTRYKIAIATPGNYTLQIRAMDIWGQVGEPVSINFTMKAPFTKTTPFYFLIAFAGLLTVLAIIYFRERQLQEKNRILEEKVKERTTEIAAQKEEITASIAYASRIQMAMLPVSNLFTESFSDFFIIFKPRDIVSGDFYWIGEDERNIYLTVADCTGHGVPGAFMSTLGISLLNEIVTHNKNLQASTFLNLLREKIKTLLHQTGKEGEAADGMDISMCVISKQGTKLQYAGAYNPVFIHANGSLREYKADRMPIGIHYGCEVPFRNYDININKGDVIYLLSDGLTDQFGGDEGSKYKKAQLKKLLTKIHHIPMPEQQKFVEEEFISWKGRYEQVDDITVIGVRI